ncbi:MAG TPA: hypothetical protein VHD36_16650 [Pirellulales bacterium]|nr:hypothetical protein [Pirellulales bacterium]
MPHPSARTRLTAVSVVVTVTIVALFGMVLGGAFGAAAGKISPGIFQDMMLHDVEPQRAAIVLGAFGGIMCGGALGGLAVVAEMVSLVVSSRLRDQAPGRPSEAAKSG